VNSYSTVVWGKAPLHQPQTILVNFGVADSRGAQPTFFLPVRAQD